MSRSMGVTLVSAPSQSEATMEFYRVRNHPPLIDHWQAAKKLEI